MKLENRCYYLQLLFIIIVLGYPKMKEPNFLLKRKEEMQEYAKHILSAFYYTEYLQEKKSVLDATEPKNRTES